MKRLIPSVLAALSVPLCGVADDSPSYTLATPTAPVIRITADESENK